MPSRIDQFTLQRTLGSGVSAKVKLAHDENGKAFALKVFDLSNPSLVSKTIELLCKEVAVYKGLEHPNIVKLYDFKEDATKVKENGSTKKVCYIVLELVTGGELFDYVALRPFSPEICRYYFRQML